MKRNAIELTKRHRWSIYIVTLVLLASGVVWAWLHYFAETESEFGAQIHPAEPWMLKAHGAAAMAMLLLLGTLVPLHIKRGWKAGRNRRSGGGVIALFAVLSLTGYGLYYAGDESFRKWTSWLHLGLGLALPVVLPLHIWLGRRSRKGKGV